MFRSKVSLRGFSSWITWRAAAHTSASTQPPPTVPTIEPSSRTKSFADSKLGIEPRTLTMVARAALIPEFRSRVISSYTSMYRYVIAVARTVFNFLPITEKLLKR